MGSGKAQGTRGTGTVLLAVAVFAASLAVFDHAASAGIEALDAWTGREPEARQRLEALSGKLAYRTLILGSSRAFEGLHPSAIAPVVGHRVFKEAGKGQGLRYSYEFYRLFTSIVGTPAVVIFGVDYFMFSSASDPRTLRRVGVEDAPPSGRWAWLPLRTAAEKPANDRTLLRILERLQERVSSSTAGFDPERDVEDMQSYAGRTDSRVVARPAPAEFPRLEFPRYPGVEGEYFARLLDAWVADGVAVVFVNLPDYIATYRTNAEHAHFADYFRELLYGRARCVFLDFNDPARFPLDRGDYFWDGGYGNTNSHLSKRGAEAFARVLAPDLARTLADLGATRQP